MRIKNADTLTSHGNIKGRKDMVEILEAGLQAGDPYVNLKKLIRIEGKTLYVGNPLFECNADPRAGITEYNLDEIDRIYVVGAGKGIQRIAIAFEEVLGDYLTGGHVICKYGDDTDELKKITYTHAAHPTPDENCIVGCKKILEFTKDITENDLVFTLAGNGVSALLTYPVDGISIQDVIDLTYMMQIEKGVPTVQLNTIRNHIDVMKSGRITKKFQPAKMVHIVAIDVNTDYNTPTPHTYDSFMSKNIWLHFLPDSSYFKDAVDILTHWDAWDKCPKSIKDYILLAPEDNETVKFDEFKTFNDFRVFGIMPNKIGPVPMAMEKAKELGYNAVMLTDSHQCEASQQGLFVGTMALSSERHNTPFVPPVALFSTGEMVVTVGEGKCVGGRTQEYALASVFKIAGSEKIVMAACDTDGTDGPGGFIADDAPKCLSGAIVDGYTVAEAKEQNVDIRAGLKSHNTSAVHWALKNGIYATQSISVLDLNVTLIMK